MENEKPKIHNLLRRQVKKHLIDFDNIPCEFQTFVDEINRSYFEFDNDREMLERSLDLSSQELLQRNSKLRTILEAFPDHVFITNYEGVIQDCRSGIGSKLFYPKDKIIGRKIQDFSQNQIGDKFRRAIEEFKKENSPVNIEYSLVVDNTEQFFEASLLPLFQYQLVFIIRNISERKEAENSLRNSLAQLRESEGRYRTIIENSIDLILETDEEGNLFYISPNIVDLLGYEQKDLIGTNMFERVDTDDLEKVKQDYSYALMNSLPFSSEFKYHQKDGTWRYIESFGRSFKTASGNTRAVITFHDITDRKDMEADMLRTQKLESLSVLAGGIAHDFNNLLTGIMSNLFLSKQFRFDDEKYDERYDESVNAVTRASDLTRQLLTFAQGGRPIKKAVLISDILVESTNFALRGSNVNCIFFIPESIYTVEIDEGQISQVINNLIINAKQAMPEGGTIYVSVENVELDDTNTLSISPGRYIRLSVKDTGVGIPKGNISKIFDPYFTTKEEGSGLGLSTSYSIIRKHDGVMTVDSEEGVGTTFNIYLPATDGHVAEHKKGKFNRRGAGKILVMDDNAVIRSSLGMMLSEAGFKVGVSTKGEEALEKYKEARKNDCPFDLIILDLTIPGGMGGRETLENLLEIDPEVKVIVSSGYSNDPIIADFTTYGFKACVNKPYSFDELIRVVNEVLGQSETPV